MDEGEYKLLVRERILDEQTFLRAVFSGRLRGYELPWKRVDVRPVLIRGRRYLQFSRRDEKQDVTQNYAGPEAAAQLDELLALPFKSIWVQTRELDIQVQIGRRGKAVVHRRPAQERREAPSLEHDRRKERFLPVGKPDPFLEAIGIMTPEGKIRPRMQRKFHQINRFLELALESGIDRLERPLLHIVDCGCGNAYLTFAVYHVLNHVLGRPAHLVGIDLNEELIQQREELARTLGWEHLAFRAGRIVDYRPTGPVDVVLALHACDTATDEALAQAVRWQSAIILSAPCCHHHLQQQLEQRLAPAHLGAVFRHGILRERLGDLLTDALRASLLTMQGYRTDIVEFVSTEHTSKNLLIRAVRTAQPGDESSDQAYRELVEFLGVRPYLEALLEQGTIQI